MRLYRFFGDGPKAPTAFVRLEADSPEQAASKAHELGWINDPDAEPCDSTGTY